MFLAQISSHTLRKSAALTMVAHITVHMYAASQMPTSTYQKEWTNNKQQIQEWTTFCFSFLLSRGGQYSIQYQVNRVSGEEVGRWWW